MLVKMQNTWKEAAPAGKFLLAIFTIAAILIILSGAFLVLQSIIGPFLCLDLNLPEFLAQSSC